MRRSSLAFTHICLLMLIVIAGSASASFPVVGSPTNPGGLYTAIMAAYTAGDAGVTISPGTYVLPTSSTNEYFYFLFQNMKNFEIDGYNVTLEMADGTYGGFYFTGCQNMTLAGVTAYPEVPTCSQGKITGSGTDSGGPYLDVQIDAGYPTNFTNSTYWLFSPTDVANCDVYDGTTHRYKTKGVDFAITSAIALGPTNSYKFYVNSSLVLPGNGISQIGDYISLLGKSGDGFVLANGTVTLKDLTLPWGACGMAESGGGPDHLLNVVGTYQAPPPGATATAIVGGIGVNSILTRTGPDVENCSFQGTTDDMLNVHGGFDQVEQVNGTTMTVGSPWATELVKGDIIRIYDKAADLIDHATIESTPALTTFTQPSKSQWPIFADTLNYYTVTLDHVVAAQYDYFLNDMNSTGSGLKVLNCTLRNDRDVPIIVKCDNAVIEGNTIDGGTVAGITVGPSLYWGEGGFGHHVTIKNNLIENCGASAPVYTVQAAALNMALETGTMLTMTGVDNSDILVQNNTFDGNAAENINVSNASNVRIVGNTIRNTHQQDLLNGSGLGYDPGAEIFLSECQGVALDGNILQNAGPYETHVVESGPSVVGLSSGTSGVIGSGSFVNVINRANDNVFDLSGSSLVESVPSGSTTQKWTLNADSSGQGNITLQGGPSQLYLGNGGNTGVGTGLSLASGGAGTSQLWNLGWSENGNGPIFNDDGGLAVDSGSVTAPSGSTLKQYAQSSLYSQEWSVAPSDGAIASYAFDEASGTSANDGTGNGHTATLTGGATRAAGAFGSALSTSGSSQYADTGAKLLNTNESFTVAAWVKVNAIGASQTFVSQDGTNISSFYLNMMPNGYMDLTIASTDVAYSAGTTAEALQPAVTGTWYYIAGIYNAATSQVSFYVNGVLQSTVSASAAPFNASGHTEIGRAKYFGNPSDFVNGCIDNVRIYQSALTAAQIANLYTPLDSALDNYKFDEGSGTTTADATGHTVSATLIGSPTWAQGIGNTAVVLNGISQYADTGSQRLTTSQSFTVSAWVNINALGASQTFVSQDGVNISPFFLNVSPTGYLDLTVCPADVNNSTSYTAWSLQPALPGQWYHMVGVYNAAASQISLYVNGVLQNTTAVSGTPFSATGHTEIGRAKYFGNATDFVGGRIDNVRIYQRALAASEALNLYNELE